MTRSNSLAFLVLAAAMAASPASLNAACTSPAGIEGEQVYNTDYATMQFCDGTDWIGMAASGSAATELDPKVGALTAGAFCKANAGATQIVCSTAAVSLTTDVTGNLPVSLLNGGTGASASTFWRGDGTWATPTDTFSGSGTTNYVAKFTGATALGNSKIFDNGTNVGIGTAAPASLLHLTALNTETITMSQTVGTGYDTAITASYNSGEPFSMTSAGVKHYKYSANDRSVTIGNGATHTILRVEAAASTIPRMWFSGANGTDTVGFMAGLGGTANLGIYTSSLERVRIAPSGNVGIGTTTPLAKLHLDGTSELLRLSSTGFGTIYAGSDANNPWFGTSTNHDLRLITNGTEKLRIQASGNVGIGTATPTQKLQIVSAVQGDRALVVSGSALDNNWGGGITLNSSNGTTTNAYLLVSTNGLDINNTMGTPLRLFTNNTEAMRITSGGNVGIGTSSPGGRLDVNAARQATATPIQSTVSNGALLIDFAHATGGYVPGVTWYAWDNYATKPRAAMWLASGGSGSSMYFGTSNDYSIGVTNTAITIDSSGSVEFSNRVGIGNASPGGALDVTGVQQSTATPVQQTVSNGAFIAGYTTGSGGYSPGLSWYAYNNYATKPRAAIWLYDSTTGTSLQFGTSNNFSAGVTNTALIIDQNGNVGIGTTAPSTGLDLNGAQTFRGMAAPALSPAGQGRIYYDTSANKFKASQNGGAYVDLLGGGSSQWLDGASGAIYYSGGNVGIGTTTPVAKLDVAGIIRSNPATGWAGLDMYLNGANRSTIYNDSTYPGSIAFDTGLAQRMIITSAGNVGIGTASPSEKLDMGGGNVKMGYTTFYATAVGTSVATQVYSPFATVCTGNGYLLSANCWAQVSPYSSCPWKANASGQVAAFNCSATTNDMACSGICANVR